MERDLIAALEQINRRLDNLESTVRRLEKVEGKAELAHGLVGTLGNKIDVDFMFLVELLRQNGQLEGADVQEVESIVRDRVAGKKRSWSASERAADENVTAALSVLAGDYRAD
jgi:hypothetical protein